MIDARADHFTFARARASLPAGLWVLAALASSAPAQTLSPPAGARDVCPDMPLQLTFDAAPALAGTLEIRDTADNSLAAAIDLSKPTATQTIGGLPNYVYHPFILSGHVLTLYPPNHALGYNKTYAVNVPAAMQGLKPDTQAWRFTTKVAAPPADAARLTVAADGTGDFATLQGAIDFVPDHNKIPRTILIQPGTYNEILCLLHKENLTLMGADRKKTILACANNDRFNNNANGNPFGPGTPQPGAADPAKDAVYRRGVLLAHQCRDLTIANLTIRNTTPKGGTQAETIILNGSPTDAHTILAGLDLYSFQDTVQFNGQTYIKDCYIEGDVDFIWGTGPSFFDGVHARALTNAAIFTTVRCPPTAPGNHGFVFKDSALDGNPGVTNCILARIEANRFPTSETVLLNCELSSAISPAGWRAPTGGDASKVHYWEFNSHDAAGKPVDAARRIANAKQLTADADKQTIAHYSDPTFVLGGDWTPHPPELPK